MNFLQGLILNPLCSDDENLGDFILFFFFPLNKCTWFLCNKFKHNALWSTFANLVSISAHWSEISGNCNGPIGGGC